MTNHDVNKMIALTNSELRHGMIDSVHKKGRSFENRVNILNSLGNSTFRYCGNSLGWLGLKIEGSIRTRWFIIPLRQDLRHLNIKWVKLTTVH